MDTEFNFEHSHLIKELQDQKQALDVSAIVAATNRQGQITYVNDKFCEISEYSREELLGQDHRIVNSKFHPKSFFVDLWKTISSGKIWYGEVKNRSKTGRLYWVKTTIVPFIDETGQPYQYLSIRQDITALKEAQQVILDQQSKLVAASKLSALGELSAALTHEINNPLAVILGRAEMVKNLLSQPTPNIPNIIKMVDAIESTGRRIEKIMKTVRALSHGGESEGLQTLSLRTVVDSALDIVGARIKNHGVKLTIDLHQPEKALTCRPTEIFQILINLLNNASEAVHKTPEPWVTLKTFEFSEDDLGNGQFAGTNQSTSANQSAGSGQTTGASHSTSASQPAKQNKFIVIQVSDSGNGIPEEIIQKLFTPFFTTKQVGVGTGLGLTISSSLAQRNGASLTYNRNFPTTCFELKLPVEAPEHPLRA